MDIASKEAEGIREYSTPRKTEDKDSMRKEERGGGKVMDMASKEAGGIREYSMPRKTEDKDSIRMEERGGGKKEFFPPPKPDNGQRELGFFLLVRKG
jgi:hypothetical protein